MFRSIQYTGELLDRPPGECAYTYTIEDSDFEESWWSSYRQKLYVPEVRAGAVIRCYETKGLNIPLNLSMYHRYMQEKFEWYKLEDEINYNVQHTFNYYKYVDGVRYYLNRFNQLKAFW